MVQLNEVPQNSPIQDAVRLLREHGKVYVEELTQAQFEHLKRLSDRGHVLYLPAERCFYEKLLEAEW